MHNEREENSITRARETERQNGELEIDYQRNRVMFPPNALREFTFSLPLTRSRTRRPACDGIRRDAATLLLVSGRTHRPAPYR
jgi:hypothetical protein